MAKRLTPQAKAQRLHDQGFSDRQIARVTGYSPSSVGRIRRGQQSGEKIAAPLNEFFKLGKRARQNVVSGEITLPSAKPAPAPKVEKAPEPVLSLFDQLIDAAEKHLARFANSTKVVVQVDMASGKSRTLFARGGIEAGKLKGRLQDAIEDQAGRQGGNKDSKSPEGVDWDDVIDIKIQRY